MLFNSIEFLIFLPVVCVIYFTIEERFRVFWLLVSSCVFYMAFIPIYILILFLTILVDYLAAILMERVVGARRRIVLVASILCTCAILFFFKYYNFFVGSFNGVMGFVGYTPSFGMLNIILPVGLSFHTFQSLSYVIEVYRGTQKAERDFVIYSTYVMFFPQLVAGPIERPQNLLHQFRGIPEFEHARVTSGLRRIAWGFFKKLVVADRLAIYVNDVYAAPYEHNGLQLSIATVFFAYQIYCDFSGYSDIAIGCARILGLRLMENFESPYHSASVGEFWRRWHISLSTWFKDYVYLPMGGSRVDQLRWTRNVLVTFGISGLWHGANWTYVFWGLLNGVYLVLGSMSLPLRDRFFGTLGIAKNGIFRRISMVTTTFFLTCIAWVFFRAATLSDGFYILTSCLTGWDFSVVATEHFLLRQLPIAVLGIIAVEAGEICIKRKAFRQGMLQLPLQLRWACYSVFVLGVVLLGVYQEHHFIYFQF